MSELPEGWVAERMDRLVEPRGEKVAPTDHPNMRFVGMDHVEAHTGQIVGSVAASEMKSAAARFYAGDVLYGRLRPYLNKVALPDEDGLASAEFIVFAGDPALDARFFGYRLRSRDFVSFASHLNEGDRPRVNFDQIGQFRLLVPPINEQRRIVERIETLFAEIEKGVESLHAARTTLAPYRQSLLKSAFEGRLTAGWRAANPDKLETPDALLARIKSEREAQYKAALAEWKAACTAREKGGWKGKKPRKPRRLKMETTHPIVQIPSYIAYPPEWAATPLVSVVDIIGGSTPKGVEDCSGKDIPFFKVSDMNRSEDKKLMNTANVNISQSDAEQLNLIICPSGTIVFPKRGGAILTNKKRMLGRPGAYDLNTMGFVAEADAVDEQYVWFWTMNIDLNHIYDGSNVPQINNKDVEPLIFPLCSSGEQAEIVRILDERLSAADALGEEIEAGLKRADALRQSILTEAFAGRLVPQDLDDEPADVLLERIRAERAAKPKRRRRTTKSERTEELAL